VQSGGAGEPPSSGRSGLRKLDYRRDFTFHDLRHTGNHLASMSGASTRELMQRMGHSTMRAALIYQHATDERAREIADRLNEVVERETKARDRGTPDDEDGAAGVLVPAG
jgi:integrase